MRVPFQKRGGKTAQNAQGLGGGGNAAPSEPGGIVQFPAGLIELAKGTGYPHQKRGTEAIKLHAPAAAVEEGNAELGLETRHDPAESGLRDVELLGRTADMFMASHSLEVAQLKQIHRHYLSLLRRYKQMP